jgi:MerR family copper efflux transcriptional regulator
MRVYDHSMGTTFRIKQVAEASGFSVTTLRYYEQRGVLPPASRTAAGYRTYDQRTLETLAFIARAKQLGCTLDEIAGLTVAWDGGECGPVQQELRNLVAEKTAATDVQITELVTFRSDLQRAAAALEVHRPDGACDDRCGCASAPPVAPLRPVELSPEPDVAGGSTITCTLAAGAVVGRLAEWHSLLRHVVRREPIAGGVRAVFAADVATDELIRLVAAEQRCCQFFQFAITVDARGIALEVRAADEALSIVTTMFGTPEPAP